MEDATRNISTVELSFFRLVYRAGASRFIQIRLPPYGFNREKQINPGQRKRIYIYVCVEVTGAS